VRLRDGELELSASDLAGHLACAHLTFLDRRAARGELAKPGWTDPALERLKQRGEEHERAYVDWLRAQGREVVALNGLPRPEAERRTREAVHAGAEVIVQAALRDGRWLGSADVLVRTSEPSRERAWSYEVQDTKLAQETRGGTVLQLCLYADLLTTLQGSPATALRVVKPGADFPGELFRFAEFEAYYRQIKRRLAAFVAGDGAEPYPEPIEHCEICRWWQRCDTRRRADDHLSLVAGMRRAQADELRRQGRASLTNLARAREALDEPPVRGQRESFDALHAQARLQLEERETKEPAHEKLPPEPGRGLARLPEPDAGDVFLDFEGDPFVGEPGAGGLEYLLGYACCDEGGAARYTPLWALERAAEKRAFEAFVDFLLARAARFPAFHVYHYAPYEPAALKRLASRHATRERELDVLLRAERFVDLYAVVRQGVRASVESYSLKPLEAHFGYRREVDLREAARPALERVSAALENDLGHLIEPADRAAVQGYNQDDCLSLIALQRWLEELRAELVAEGAALERPPLKDGAAEEDKQERDAELQALFARLVEGLPAEAEARTAEQRARWLLAHLIEYFRREGRVAWWEYFARRELDDEGLRRERKALVGLRFVAELPRQGKERTPVHRYEFEPQEADIDAGDTLFDPFTDTSADRAADEVGGVRAIDVSSGWIEIKKTAKWGAQHPRAVHAFEYVRPDPMPESLHALVRWVAEHGLESARPEHRAARDLLLALPPRGVGSGALQGVCATPLDDALRVARALDGGVLAIQGPPGSGKTWNGARLIVALARARKRVGVSAVSHKVIRNMLEAALGAADEERTTLRVTHKTSKRRGPLTDLRSGYETVDDDAEALAALARGHVVGGVAWSWAGQGAEAKLDYLFIDEAGQMSLAQVLACARAAKNLVLLGDPQQLQQPQRGAHPEGADVSALAHLLGGAPTIDPERGLFLAETWRLAPALCAFTSRLFYADKLSAHEGCERQRLDGPTRFAGSGLFLVEVAHAGNQSSASEEVAMLERVVAELLQPGVTWTDVKGVAHPLTRADILVIAPYNAQVAALSRSNALKGLHVGTVDLFQGQERPVVLYSLTSSSPLDAPRGLPFLYDPHRLNVATSRARCACIVVASPALFEPECRTPEQMRLANGLCALAEAARVVELTDAPAPAPRRGSRPSARP